MALGHQNSIGRQPAQWQAAILKRDEGEKLDYKAKVTCFSLIFRDAPWHLKS